MSKPFVTIYILGNDKRKVTYAEWNRNRDKFSGLTYHRVDGPAIEWSDNFIFHYINGESLTEGEYIKLIQEIKDMPEVLRLIDPRKWVREFK